MPDEDDGLLDELGELANEAILVETLMGWDGEACACEACNCARFRDGDQDGRCTLCRAGNHTP